MARAALLFHAFTHSIGLVKDTWLAEGISDLIELIGGIVKILGNEDSREKLREGEIKWVELDARVMRQAEEAKEDYTGLVTKYIDPLQSNLVQQIARFITPEGRLKGTGTDLLLYNLGLQWIANDKRTDIFGQTVRVLPGDQGIAWPREEDERWAKMWGYNIHLTDISPKDKITIGGVERTLEWDEYVERKKLTNELFKQRFDEYFANSTVEQLQKRFTTYKVDARSKIKTNYIHEDINDILIKTKDDVKSRLIVWDEQAKKNPELFNFMMEESCAPSFYNEKMIFFKSNGKDKLRPIEKGDDPEKAIIIPYNSLEKINKRAMELFTEKTPSWVKLDAEERAKRRKQEDGKYFSIRVNEKWSDATKKALKELNEEIVRDVKQMPR
jgi:hypothetical protein